jgi:hypothetical protein
MHRAVGTGVPVLGNDVQAALVSRVCSNHQGGAAYGRSSGVPTRARLAASRTPAPPVLRLRLASTLSSASWSSPLSARNCWMRSAPAEQRLLGSLLDSRTAKYPGMRGQFAIG